MALADAITLICPNQNAEHAHLLRTFEIHIFMDPLSFFIQLQPLGLQYED